MEGEETENKTKKQQLIKLLLSENFLILLKPKGWIHFLKVTEKTYNVLGLLMLS